MKWNVSETMGSKSVRTEEYEVHVLLCCPAGVLTIKKVSVKPLSLWIFVKTVPGNLRDIT